MRVRSWVLVGCALALLSNKVLAANASKFAVTNIVTPRSAGTVSSVKVTAQTSTGSTATTYRGTIRFTSTDVQALLPANYTFTAADAGVHTFTNGVTLLCAPVDAHLS